MIIADVLIYIGSFGLSDMLIKYYGFKFGYYLTFLITGITIRKLFK